MIERILIATAAGLISGGVTLIVGGSLTLAIVLCLATAVLTVLFRDLFLFIGWGD